ncbi:RNB-domain-containing protein [Mucor ambiguus]|uniref:RNB-domain-containing protein n=1 Tax=Mucor ambiguus TaxID=91626 RepID=A0A0C9LUA1_9FUNG|nr:RNB-domain-containing protein [Mucor ambiguus]
MAKQHPLAVESHLHPNQMLAAVDTRQEPKKSLNSRRRRRGSRRRSSTVADVATEEEKDGQEEEQDDISNQAQPSTESDPFFTAVQQQSNHKSRRRSSHTGARSKAKHRVSLSKKEEDDESPAFQSLVDIISEMKRLPSISITPDTNTDESTAATVAMDTDANAWKRVRRHSEPPQKMRQQHQPHQHDNGIKKNGSVLKTINEQHQRFGEPVFTNSFLPLEEEEDGENKYADVLVSPLNNDKEHMTLATSPPHRSRSQSVPNTLVNQHHSISQDHPANGRKPLYPAHLNSTEAAAAVRSRFLYSGMLKVDMQDSSEANVECEELDAFIYIFGSKYRNRALDGDQVAVELMDVDDMLNEKSTKRQVRYTRRLSAMSLNGGQAASSSVTSSGGLSSIPEDNSSVLLDAASEMAQRPKYCGRVVCILDRPKNMLFSGTLSLYRPHAKTLDNGSRDKKETHGPKIIWFIPADKRLPLVAVPIKNAPADFIKYHEEYKNRIFLGNILRWPVTSLHPFGSIEKEIGWVGELGVHSGVLLADHHIKDAEFSEQVMKAAAAVPTKISHEDKKGRRDLSQEQLDIFTFGGGNQDLGCAFSVTPADSAEKGIYEVGIHVPDVAAYVVANTPLDREVRERCCAVNLVDKKIPILPESFIKSHCRFDIGKQRLAYSVMCRFTENGVLLHAWIGKTLVKTKLHVDTNHLTSDASAMLKLCKKLQQNRLHKLEGVSLAHPLELFTLADSGYPQDITRVHQTEQEVLMQELLILANTEVAQKISTRFPDQALLYRQAPANMSNLATIQDYFDNAPSTSTIQGLLNLAKEKETSTEKQDTLVHMIRRAIPLAKYYSAGSVDISKFRHTSFGASIYTVFTEPTHNYASIYIQRQLDAALKGEGQDSENYDLVDKIARHCNSAHLLKMAAEQESKKLYTAAYIYRQCLNEEVKKITVDSFVTQIKAGMLQLYVPEYDLELSVVINDQSLPGGQHTYDPVFQEMELTWSANNSNNTDEKDDEKQIKHTLKQLSCISISILVDMKAIKPVFQVEILKQQ